MLMPQSTASHEFRRYMIELSRRQLLGSLAAFGSAALLPRVAWATGRFEAGLFAPTIALMDQFVPRHLAEFAVPGLTLGLADREGNIATAAYGLSDIKLKTPVTREHLFQIGSISKSFVALVLLALREEGKLDLHRPILEYLPWLRIRSSFAPITAHHLLTHTSGLPNAGLAVPRADGDDLVPTYAPGKRFYYSNLGYVILGHLIEVLDRRDYIESTRLRIFKPLGMNDSFAMIGNASRERMVGSYRAMYDDRPHPRNGALREATFLNLDHPSGSILSSPADMALYITMLLRHGQGIISEASFALFCKPHVVQSPDVPAVGYGYGVFVDLAFGRTILRHTGGMQSFGSAMLLDMEGGVGAFASGNHSISGYRPNAVSKLAMQSMLAASQGLPAPTAPAPIDIFAVVNAVDYVGIYREPGGTRSLEIVTEGSRLFVLHKSTRVPLQVAADRDFLALHPDFSMFPFEFGRTGNAKSPVAELGYGPLWLVRDGVSLPSVTLPAGWRSYLGEYRGTRVWEVHHRVYERNGKLYLGGEQLRNVGPATFTFGEMPDSPERVFFTDLANGKAWRFRSAGQDYFRVRSDRA